MSASDRRQLRTKVLMLLTVQKVSLEKLLLFKKTNCAPHNFSLMYKLEEAWKLTKGVYFSH